MDDGASGEKAEPAPPSVIRPTDEQSLALARRLVREARYAALSVIEPGTGHPFASRVLTGTDVDGVPVILASMLATHMKAILADPRSALLFGEPGRGDPLAWPRITVRCAAEMVEHDSESDSRIRARFLRRHPKAKLYASFRDFAFFRLVPKSASLNGGFGRAYNISGGELVIDSPVNDHIGKHELQIIEALASSGRDIADSLANRYFGEKTDNWYISGVDAEGIDLARKEKLRRIALANRVSDPSGLIAEHSNVLKWRDKN